MINVENVSNQHPALNSLASFFFIQVSTPARIESANRSMPSRSMEASWPGSFSRVSDVRPVSSINSTARVHNILTAKHWSLYCASSQNVGISRIPLRYLAANCFTVQSGLCKGSYIIPDIIKSRRTDEFCKLTHEIGIRVSQRVARSSYQVGTV